MPLSTKNPLLLRFSGVLALALVTCANLCAQSAAAPTWTAGAVAVSQYMFRGLRLGGPALQPYVERDAAAWALGVSASTPLADKVPGRSDPEIDPYGWYRVPLDAALTLQPGFTWYTYPRAQPERGYHRASFEPNLALNYTVDGVLLTPKVYYDFNLRGATAELNAAYAVPLRALGTELDVNANVGTYRWDDAIAHTAQRTKNWGDYWQVGATLPYQIFSSRVSLGVAYAAGWDNFLKQGGPQVRNPLAARRVVVTLAYSKTW